MKVDLDRSGITITVTVAHGRLQFVLVGARHRNPEVHGIRKTATLAILEENTSETANTVKG
jgi:hypothetical protein